MSEDAAFDTALQDIFDTLGVDITYKGNVIKGDFTDYTRAIDIETGEIEAAGPMVDIMNDDCVGIKKGDTLTIGTDTYKVVSWQKRGYETTTVHLVKL